MPRRRKSRTEKNIEGVAGLIVIGLGMLWLTTGSMAFVIKVLYILVIVLFGIGLFFYLQRRRKLIASGIDEIDRMKGTEFEQLLLEYFRSLGYRGKITKEYADYGADLLLVKDNTKYVVQAKRWNQKVGIRAIQEIVASINHYNADRGIVITNNYFTQNAENLARSNNIELRDRNKLIDMMSRVQRQDVVEKPSVSDGISIADYTCPRCGNKLILRSGSGGNFYGCKSFPKCRYTQNFC